MPNLEQELATLQTGAALYPLTGRAFLRITGSDATRWLNGMVTNNIKNLAPGEGNYNFLLNAQGRIQADCTIYREPDEPILYRLATDSSQLETITALFDKFIIMDDVELLPNPSNAPKPVLVLGSKAPAILHRYYAGSRGADFSTLAPFRLGIHTEGLSDVITPGPAAVPKFEMLAGLSRNLDEAAKAENAVVISQEALEAHRILSGTPKFGTDIRTTDLPQETNQTHALHFAKGCYLGQEIVERIRSRGQVHRTFIRFTLQGDLPTSLPSPLTANAKPAGEITSAIRVGDTLHALGYIRREALELRQTITYSGGTAIPKPVS